VTALTRRNIVIAVSAAFVVATTGGLLTELGPWYQALRVPAWKPPDWAFGPIWTTIFALTTWAGLRGWRDATDSSYRIRLLVLLALNAASNILWSVLFFKMYRPDWAFVEVWLLWTSVLGLLGLLGRTSRLSAALMVPYLAWVSTAAYLNYSIIELNGPFAGR
jgi:tryptophan-rich sensory protein